MNKTVLFIAVIAVLAAQGCDKAEQIPAYVTIQPFTVQAPGGEATQKITEGWLYVNTEFLGAYTLPATVPILAQGNSQILVFPGVKENGIFETPNIYPFLQRYEMNADFTPNAAITVNPVTQYINQAKMPWTFQESAFDGSAIPLSPNTSYTLAVDTAIFGSSVYIELDTANPVLEVRTDAVELPNTGCCQIWLELNYRNNVPFSLILRGETGNYVQTVYLFNLRENWNKIYLNLSDIILLPPQEDRYQLIFVAGLPLGSNNKPSQDSGFVWLDNIRLLHF